MGARQWLGHTLGRISASLNPTDAEHTPKSSTIVMPSAPGVPAPATSAAGAHVDPTLPAVAQATAPSAAAPAAPAPAAAVAATSPAGAAAAAGGGAAASAAPAAAMLPEAAKPRLGAGYLRPLPGATATKIAVGPSSQGRVLPPTDEGLPAVASEELLKARAEVIDRLRLAYGRSPQDFDTQVLDIVRRYAEFVNLLPATPDNFFSNPGGMFDAGLLTGFFALQGTDSRLVAGTSTITERNIVEPRYRLATFIAGLLSQLYRTLSHCIVTDADGQEWPSYMTPLTPWLHSRGQQRFFVRWLTGNAEVRGLGLYALPQVVSAQVLSYLSEQNTVILPWMYESITGLVASGKTNHVHEVVRRASALVLDLDLRQASNLYGRAILGAHLEAYLLDAMRQLVARDTRWRPNGEKSRVWVGKDGLFLVWPGSCTEIRELLESSEIRGVPSEPQTLLEILGSANLLERNPADQSYIWRIAPGAGDSTLEAVRFTRAEILLGFETHSVTPLDRPLVVTTSGKAKGGKSSSPGTSAGGTVLDLFDSLPKGRGPRAPAGAATSGRTAPPPTPTPPHADHDDEEPPWDAPIVDIDPLTGVVYVGVDAAPPPPTASPRSPRGPAIQPPPAEDLGPEPPHAAQPDLGPAPSAADSSSPASVGAPEPSADPRSDGSTPQPPAAPPVPAPALPPRLKLPRTLSKPVAEALEAALAIASNRDGSQPLAQAKLLDDGRLFIAFSLWRDHGLTPLSVGQELLRLGMVDSSGGSRPAAHVLRDANGQPVRDAAGMEVNGTAILASFIERPRA